jgi:hypothetical protein
MSRLAIARILLVAAGVASFSLSAWGSLASLGLDFRSIRDVLLALCFVMPLPVYMMGIYSLRWSTSLLWVLFLAQWAVRLTIKPNPATNPLDEIGLFYVSIAFASQAAYWFRPKGMRQKLLQRKLDSELPEESAYR